MKTKEILKELKKINSSLEFNLWEKKYCKRNDLTYKEEADLIKNIESDRAKILYAMEKKWFEVEK